MSLPYFPMFAKDYEAKTAHLTILEDGAYNRLLRLCWMTPGCTLPDDEQWIMRKLRARTEEEKEAVRTVLEEFFETKKGRVFQQNLLDIYESSVSRHKSAVENGKKGGRPRKSLENNTSGKSYGKPDAKANGKLKKANQNHNQNHNTPLPPEGGSDLFGEDRKKPAKETPATILCDVIPEETARALIDYRQKKRKPLTVHAAKLAVTQLRKFSDPVASVNQTILNGWTGFFEPKGDVEPGRGDSASKWRDRIDRKYGAEQAGGER